MNNILMLTNRNFHVAGLFTALFLLSTAISCKKDANSSGTFFEFKVNGRDFKASGLLAYATNFSDDFAIYGIEDQNSKEVCYISLPKGIAAGTHALNDGDHSGYYVDADNQAFSTNWGASSGSVTIEEIDASHVKGTFQFIAYDSDTESIKKTLSEGKFNVDFR